MKKKRWEKAFLEGYKPATIAFEASPYFRELKEYPSIEPFTPYHSKGIIFFQTESQKESYQKQITETEWNSYAFHHLIGTTLGFPERSVQFYSEMRQLEQKLGRMSNDEKKQSVGISWAGFYFSTKIDLVVSEIQWLWQKYNNTKSAENPLFLWDIGIETEIIPFGNLEKLVESHDRIAEKKGIAIQSKT